jgi:SAM-dependent MidA family methyltransferase
MKLGNPDLTRCIRAEIDKQGPISFARFMHQALYHPEHGYYSSGRCAIGRKGDYFTNVSVGPLFGKFLAAQFAEMWERLGSVEDFTIIEQGAHDGQFARDVLESVQKRAPEFFAALRYRIVEPFPILQDRQSRTLERFRDKVEWRDSLQPFLGVHFSNELLDAMPVRLISGNMEKLVDLEGDKFVLIQRPLSERAAVSKLPMDRGAFNQPALEWIDDIAAKLQRGYVITIDYGFFGDKSQRNVQVRAQHRHLDSPFEGIGGADITMPVDWRSVVDRAQANGLRLAGFTDQHHFLTGIVSALGLPDSPKLARELQTLLHPEMLGRAFQVLGLTKNIDPAAQPLSGFKFARAPRSGA